MLSTFNLLLLLALAGAAVFAWNNWRAREQAERMARETCKRMGLQFLDDTVSLKSWRPVREADPVSGLKVWALRRVFQFEFSRQGADRWPAEMITLNGRLLGVEFNLVNASPPEMPVVRPRDASDQPSSTTTGKIIPFKRPSKE